MMVPNLLFTQDFQDLIVARKAFWEQKHIHNLVKFFKFKGVVRDFGHGTSFPSEPVCYLSLETVCNTFHSVLLVAEISGARLAQVEGIC